MKLQRWGLMFNDGAWCKSDDVADLEAEHAELLEALNEIHEITHALWLSGFGYIDKDEPYDIPQLPLPEGWTSLSIPWIGEERVLVMWEDKSELPFFGTYENYISRTKYCLKPIKMGPFAWKVFDNNKGEGDA